MEEEYEAMRRQYEELQKQLETIVASANLNEEVLVEAIGGKNLKI